jgi:hypothetical protein
MQDPPANNQYLIGGYVTTIEDSATAVGAGMATRGGTNAGGEGKDWAGAGKQSIAVDDDGYVDARVCADVTSAPDSRTVDAGSSGPEASTHGTEFKLYFALNAGPSGQQPVRRIFRSGRRAAGDNPCPCA